VLANPPAAAVPQAVAITVPVLGWVVSGKGIGEDLLWGTLPETCAGYKNIWGLTGCSLSRQTEHLPGLCSFRSEGNHKITDTEGF